MFARYFGTAVEARRLLGIGLVVKSNGRVRPICRNAGRSCSERGFLPSVRLSPTRMLSARYLTPRWQTFVIVAASRYPVNFVF
jgi:hypothetical protein